MLVFIKPLSTFPKLHSDTLFGAITSAISELYPDLVGEMLVEFDAGRPPFLISSAFPVIYDNEAKIKFFPKIIWGSDLSDIDSEILKDYKKVAYIQEEIFFELINGKLSENDLLKDYDSYNLFSNLLFKNEVNVDVGIGENILPNNSVNRLSNETKIFYSNGDSYYNLGLFFLVDFFDEKYKEIVMSAVKFLKDRGFGKDISTGKGHFDYEIEDSEQISNEYEGNTFISLSRYIPTENELKRINEYSFYEIGFKRGRARSGEIRKQIRFFKEGSTFPNYQLIYGQNIKSGNNAVEYGYAFPVWYNSRRNLNES